MASNDKQTEPSVLFRYTGEQPVIPVDKNGEPIPGAFVGELPSIGGVPARDLYAADVEALPQWQYTAVAASDLYEATPEGKKALKARAPVEETPVESKPATTPKE